MPSWLGGDEEPVEPVSRHHREELATVVTPLVGLLTKASRRILRDDALADDAIQETLLSYWMRPEQPENPRAWLLRAVTLRSLHLARSLRRRRQHELRACSCRAECSTDEDPARSQDYPDLLRLLGACLERVPDDYRVVFMLWTFDELDYASIAAGLQIPIGTVRSRLSRARKAIRESLANTLLEQDPPLAVPASVPGLC